MEVTPEEFREEMDERLLEWESRVLDFEKNSRDPEVTNALFRVVHTVKGVAGTCEYTAIVTLTHALESYLDDIRRSKIVASHQFINLMLQSGDLIRRMMNDEPLSLRFNAQVDRIRKELYGMERKTVGSNGEKECNVYQPRILRTDSIQPLRIRVLESISCNEEVHLDLSEVYECDSDGIHFICSLVPLFIRSKIAISVVGISDYLVNQSFKLGIDIRNVLKRASHGIMDPSRGIISHFTITLCPSNDTVEFGDLENSVRHLQTFLMKKGDFTEHCNTVDGKKSNCTLLLSTAASRYEIEDQLEKLPETLLWTISVTPDQAQKNDAIRHIAQSGLTSRDLKKLLLRWGDRFERMCELAEVSGSDEMLLVLNEIREIQKKLKSSTVDMDEISYSVFTKAIKVIRGA